ncbi:MAG: hypothetical protein HPM95_15385 [Alphaproteobacteria bacterium]|nr:hypothetical protein [Alphaproteobacteria bacterium]
MHEAAHGTLFAMSPVEFYVFNPENERYSSPLRLDPRPLDGIYHATFVLARMHIAMRELVALAEPGRGRAGAGNGACPAQPREFPGRLRRARRPRGLHADGTRDHGGHPRLHAALAPLLAPDPAATV